MRIIECAICQGEFQDKPTEWIKLRNKPVSKLIGRISIKKQSIHEMTETARLKSEQHVELGSSRCNRDLDDLTKDYSWFQQFNPYPVG